jgi:hypothetical protein
MAELVEIGYERLFNLGNFEHEKFLIKKSVQADTEFQAWKDLAVQIAEFERDLELFRQALQSYYSLSNHIGNSHFFESEEEKNMAILKLKQIAQVVHDFEQKHKPLEQPCKCAFCQAKTQEVTGGSQEDSVEVKA